MMSLTSTPCPTIRSHRFSFGPFLECICCGDESRRAIRIERGISMLGRRIPLFKVLGFEVRIDTSWIFLAILITWSLAIGVFPTQYPNLSPFTYWGMGIVGALGLFACILIHEFSHSLVASHYGLPMKGITL